MNQNESRTPAKAADVPGPAARSEARPFLEDDRGRQPTRVLLVEDDADDFVLVRHFLSSLAVSRFELEWVQTYEEALKAMREGCCDVCLLDYQLGERNGLELLKEAIGRGFSAPVIFLTGQGDYEVDVEAMKTGATDYLVKGQINAPLLERSIRYALAHKRSEELLRESERKYSTVVENSLTGIFLVQDDRFVFVNERLAKIYGYSREELIGFDPSKLVHPEDRAFVKEIGRKRLRGEEVASEYEVRALKRDGTSIWLQVRSTFTMYKGAPAISGNVVDVTEQKRAQSALKESERQLRDLSWKLLQTQEKERELTAQDIHDQIAQTLAAIKLEAKQVVKRVDEGSMPEVEKALAPFTTMLQNAIEETRKIYTNLRPTMLNDLGILVTLQSFCREFQEVYPGIGLEKEIGIEEIEIPEDLKIVIYRIVQEACINVEKHSRADLGLISLKRVGDRIELSVTDNGVGFDLGEVFAKEKSLKGLGLAIMKQRTELSGGIFSVESAKGKGTTIRASWPVKERLPA